MGRSSLGGPLGLERRELHLREVILRLPKASRKEAALREGLEKAQGELEVRGAPLGGAGGGRCLH